MGLQANARQVTTALSNDLWLIARQVNHRGGLQGAGACIDDTCHLALVTFADILRVIQGHCFADSDRFKLDEFGYLFLKRQFGKVFFILLTLTFRGRFFGLDSRYRFCGPQ